MEPATTKVTLVRNVANANNSGQLATEPVELVLFKVHPVHFRAHPIGTLIVSALSVASNAQLPGRLFCNQRRLFRIFGNFSVAGLKRLLDAATSIRMASSPRGPPK